MHHCNAALVRGYGDEIVIRRSTRLRDSVNAASARTIDVVAERNVAVGAHDDWRKRREPLVLLSSIEGRWKVLRYVAETASIRLIEPVPREPLSHCIEAGGSVRVGWKHNFGCTRM